MIESMSRSGVESERTRLRDRMVGGLRAGDHGTSLRLAGWVHRRRDLGGLVFVDLRDRSGLVQVSFDRLLTSSTNSRSRAAADA